MFFIPSAVFVVASIKPDIGFKNKPVTPFTLPYTKPLKPSLPAPCIGYLITPFTPFEKPFIILLPPLNIPWNKC